MLSQLKINSFCVFGEIEQIRVLISLKQTESDKTNSLDIFGSFIVSVKENKEYKTWQIASILANIIFALYNVCSVHRGMFSTSGGYHEYIGGYHEYIGGYHEYIRVCSVHWGDTMSTSGGYYEYIGGIS